HTRDTAHLSAVCNADPFYSETYVQHYHKINPLLAVAEALAPGEVRSATYLTRTDAFKASAMFNEWMWPQKWADVVGVGLLRTPKERGLLVRQTPGWGRPAVSGKLSGYQRSDG
ncbi:MAG: hypothetical protein L0Y60_03545, partial [Beijerinckiaceae bacterium]|nr:hypothetical protein [Beijerinckiaceae bacterium]